MHAWLSPLSLCECYTYVARTGRAVRRALLNSGARRALLTRRRTVGTLVSREMHTQLLHETRNIDEKH